MSEADSDTIENPTATVIRGDNGVRLYCRASGDPLRPAVVFVHGYPDSHTVWDRVVAELADDFYCVRYDVRGAGASSRPRATAAYRLEHLQADLEAVMDWAGPNAPVHLVGHDWGSVQTWETVTDERRAGRIASFTSISGPCLDHVGQWLRRQWHEDRASLFKQMRRSWYILAFHVPVVPDLLWRRLVGRRWLAIAERFEGQPLPKNPTQTQDGAIGIRLYRANVFKRLRQPCKRHAQAPVQVITPLRDPFVGPGFANGLDQWVNSLTITPVDAAHWGIQTRPQTIAEHCRQFIERHTETAAFPGSANPGKKHVRAEA